MNTNCLEGMRCPNCKSEGPFDIYAHSTFVFTDDGTDEFGDVEWDDDSPCECKECNFEGIAGDFRTNVEEGAEDEEDDDVEE